MFRSKLFVKVFLVIAVVAMLDSIVIALFTMPLVRDITHRQEEKFARQVLDQTVDLVKRQAAEIEAYRAFALDKHKEKLRSVVSIVDSYAHAVYRTYQAGQLSEAAAKQQLLDYVRTFRYGKDDYVFISDYASVLISHPDERIHNSDTSQLKDVRGALIVPPLLAMARESGEGFHPYWWRRLGSEQPVEKLSYGKHFSEWQWVIVSGVYIDDIEAEVARRKQELVKELRAQMAAIKIADTGYMYVFNETGTMIIHPNADLEGKSGIEKLLDPLSGKPLFITLKATAHNPQTDEALRYLWDRPGDSGNYRYEKISWVRHVPYFDWYIASSVYTEELQKNATLVGKRTLLVSVAMLLLSLIAAYIFSRRLERPILALREGAEHVRAGNLQTHIEVHSGDEHELLAQTFNTMVAEIRSYTHDLENKVHERTIQLEQASHEISLLNAKLQADNLRMGTELEVARQLQQMVLPRAEEFLAIPELDIAGFMQPADEVGGDYYDVLHHDGRLKIGIGDVTGHGLESGVLMLMVQTAVRTLLANNVTDAQQFLCILNRVIYENVQRMGSDKNLTLSLLDYRSGGHLTITGQHEEMLVARANGEVERVDTLNLGFMVGMKQDIANWVRYLEVNLQPGDGIVLYTDGITEAMSATGEFYGIERLCQTIGANWPQSALEIQDAVINSVRNHTGTGKPFDDITLVVVKQKAAQ